MPDSPAEALCVDAGTLHIKRSVPASVIVYFGVIAQLSFGYVDRLFAAAFEVLAEEVDHTPIEVFIHIAESVALLRQIEHLEALAGAYQGIGHACGVGGVHIVVDVAVHKHQVTFELACYLGIGGYLIHKCGIAFFAHFFLHAVMGFAPPAVVDVVVVIAGCRYGGFEEVGILANGCRTHKSAARVAVYAHAIDVNPFVAIGELLYGIFVVGEWVVAHIAVTEVVIPLRAVGVSAALTHRDYHKSGLCQAVGAYGHACEGVVYGFDLRTGIHIVDYRIGLGGVHIEGLEHHAVEVGDAVGGFYLKRLGELVAGGSPCSSA